jgi:hypothetical protein
MKKLILAALCITMVFGMMGCIKFKKQSEQTLAEIGTRMAAKELGLRLRGEIEWHDSYDQFIKMVGKNGLTIDAANLLDVWIDENIHPLHREDFKALAGMVGVEYRPDGVLDNIKDFNVGLFEAAVNGLKAGLLYREQSRRGSMGYDFSEVATIMNDIEETLIRGQIEIENKYPEWK